MVCSRLWGDTCKCRVVAAGDDHQPVFLNRNLVRDTRQLSHNCQRDDARLQQVAPPRLAIIMGQSDTDHDAARRYRHVLCHQRHSHHCNTGSRIDMQTHAGSSSTPCLGQCMPSEYMRTKFGVDSSSRFRTRPNALATLEGGVSNYPPHVMHFSTTS